MTSNTPTASPDDVVIVGAARTAQGRLLGSLASKTAPELGAAAVSAALDRSGIAPADVEYVLMGQVVQAGAGQNPAKQTAVAAGLPMTVPAMTVNKVCLSGLDAVISGGRMLRAGDVDVVVAGGQESMSSAPHLAAGVRAGKGYGSLALQDSLERDGLSDAVHGTVMGAETEEGNTDRGITREEQDHVAALSQQRAEKARDEGIFADEIVPVEVRRRKETVTVDSDEGIRPGTTEEGLAGLRPAFAKDGTITAASASQISDGAAAVVLVRRSYAEEHGLTVLATLGDYGQTAGPDTKLHSQPSQALLAALAKAGRDVSDLDFLEINEAFAAVVVQSLRDLDYPLEKTNIHGGGISLGHPIGCSGARLVVHAAYELQRRDGGLAGVSLCGGGGQGDALLLWR
ncbi:acetyl-CoA C-acetyltransferase [Corynebacterium bovis]|uniref:Probable acetyl-CoA acetyltransferase n=2 Tax=Corynebacterium bovis TaxID=36808 RepID=A0A3R8QV63_9CORY|nr:acetyl-CoA C-acetyltransferase [Corynebacterium bovis]MBB3115721.1 acetyl-CoA C-acetyltransferase [Corynebacterium bovis DSM 20582 = CIP 54.80]MDH2455462.1 acetyl-CoA C-acetyltransferase [Corynebacterium bovis]MDK8511646.1 acetyl-CoA C-acetyltransferase [Corynebacterium bovis]QQC47404.1 acetyl-CoA C-acetyltransferase [Corynebacterium bovis]RRO85901.1 acetyl-CoA C-acetyltransferase [Corynebacterium bovis]